MIDYYMSTCTKTRRAQEQPFLSYTYSIHDRYIYMIRWVKIYATNAIIWQTLALCSSVPKRKIINARVLFFRFSSIVNWFIRLVYACVLRKRYGANEKKDRKTNNDRAVRCQFPRVRDTSQKGPRTIWVRYGRI